jgi:predicted N-formylglutamate amidohydrolase
MPHTVRCACLLTCEHASNAVPRRLHPLFSKQKSLLRTHRGYDIGAKEYAEALACHTGWPLFCGSYTRLLVDLNRSTHLFPPILKELDRGTKREINKTYYQPFRSQVFAYVRNQIASGLCVIHLSCHTFTPVLNGVVRPMDLGLLYDPSRRREKEVAERVMCALQAETSMYIRANAPYKGTSDGHVTALRKQFPKESYVGLEIEVNQSLFCPSRSELWKHVWLPRLIGALAQIPILQRNHSGRLACP